MRDVGWKLATTDEFMSIMADSHKTASMEKRDSGHINATTSQRFSSYASMNFLFSTNSNSSNSHNNDKDSSSSGGMNIATLQDAISKHTMKTTMGIFTHQGSFHELMSRIAKCQRPKSTAVDMKHVIKDIKLLESILTSNKLKKADMKSQCYKILLNRSWSHIAEIVRIFKVHPPSSYMSYAGIGTKQVADIDLFDALKMMDNLAQYSDTRKALTEMCQFAYRPYHFWADKVKYLMKICIFV